jgi:hypothetical protein
MRQGLISPALLTQSYEPFLLGRIAKGRTSPGSLALGSEKPEPEFIM